MSIISNRLKSLKQSATDKLEEQKTRYTPDINVEGITFQLSRPKIKLDIEKGYVITDGGHVKLIGRNTIRDQFMSLDALVLVKGWFNKLPQEVTDALDGLAEDYKKMKLDLEIMQTSQKKADLNAGYAELAEKAKAELKKAQ